jgi:hypothetical protein
LAEKTGGPGKEGSEYSARDQAGNVDPNDSEDQPGDLDPNDPAAVKDVRDYGGLSEKDAQKLLSRLRELLGTRSEYDKST